MLWYYNPLGRLLVSELPVLLGRFFDFCCNLWFWVFEFFFSKWKNLGFWVLWKFVANQRTSGSEFLRICDKSKNLSFENSQNEIMPFWFWVLRGWKVKEPRKFHQRTGKEPLDQGRLVWAQSQNSNFFFFFWKGHKDSKRHWKNYLKNLFLFPYLRIHKDILKHYNL